MATKGTRLCVLCKSALSKKIIFITETECAHSEVQAEAGETVEHRAYNVASHTKLS